MKVKGGNGDNNKKGKITREKLSTKTKKDIADFFNKINKGREATKGDASRVGPEWAASDSTSKFSKGFGSGKGPKLPTPPLIAKVSTKPSEKKKQEKSPTKHKTHTPPRPFQPMGIIWEREREETENSVENMKSRMAERKAREQAMASNSKKGELVLEEKASLVDNNMFSIVEGLKPGKSFMLKVKGYLEGQTHSNPFLAEGRGKHTYRKTTKNPGRSSTLDKTLSGEYVLERPPKKPGGSKRLGLLVLSLTWRRRV